MVLIYQQDNLVPFRPPLGVKGGGDLEFLRAQTRKQGPPLACTSFLELCYHRLMNNIKLRVINNLNHYPLIWLSFDLRIYKI